MARCRSEIEAFLNVAGDGKRETMRRAIWSAFSKGKASWNLESRLFLASNWTLERRLDELAQAWDEENHGGEEGAIAHANGYFQEPLRFPEAML